MVVSCRPKNKWVKKVELLIRIIQNDFLATDIGCINMLRSKNHNEMKRNFEVKKTNNLFYDTMKNSQFHNVLSEADWFTTGLV